MPAAKRKTAPRQSHPQQQQHHHHQHQPSDYETDTANFTEATALEMTAPPAGRTNTDINLAVLRRHYPSITSILSIAPFAVVYRYSPEGETWEKIGVEGTAFVCELRDDRHDDVDGSGSDLTYAVIILNRKSLDNFLLPLERVSADDIELTPQFVIVPVVGGGAAELEEEDPRVYGLWIFEEEGGSTREAVAGVIIECALQAEAVKKWREEGHGQTEMANAGHAVPEYNLDGEGAAQEYDSRAEQDMSHGVQDLGGFAQAPLQQQPPQPQQQELGRQIDLMALFGKPGLAPKAEPQRSEQRPFTEPATAWSHPDSTRSAQFAHTADTDFFRTTRTPTAAAQPVHAPQEPPPPPPQQQSALLDLFKNAKKG